MPRVTEPTIESQHGAWIEIHRASLIANLQALLADQLPGTQALTVVKANAYGHGLIEVSRALEQHAAYLGVTSLNEALELREHDLGRNILLFAPVLSHEIPLAVSQDLTLSVSSFQEAQEISEAARSLKKEARIHIKVDTGMGRLGIPFGVALSKIERIHELPSLVLEGIFTHFPSAEADDGFTQRQVRDFKFLIAALEKKGIGFKFRHAANSSGSLKIKEPVLNMIRPGLLVYGIYPDRSLESKIKAAPALSLKSKIVSLKRLRPGDSAGYGRHFVTDKPATIAILPLGYSHGYPFRASAKAHVLFQGKAIPLAGRVSMDFMTINLGDTPACLGDEITLIGRSGKKQISVENIAEWAGTIPYEIATRLAAGLPRFYR